MCGMCREKGKESKERFRKLQTQTLTKAQMASLLTVKLQVGYELCQEHYNKLI